MIDRTRDFFIKNKLFSFSIILAIAIYLIVPLIYSSPSVQIFRYTQIFALLGFLFVYLSLLTAPFGFVFKSLLFSVKFEKARNGFIYSALLFGSIHAGTAFFKQLGGFTGLGFLSERYLIAISLSSSALILILLTVLSSNSTIVKKFTFFKKKIFKSLFYVAGILILVHAVLLGTHFVDLWQIIPQITFGAIFFLIFLEIIRLDALLRKKFHKIERVSLISIPLFVVNFLGIIYFMIPFPGELGSSFGIHAEHIRLAREAQENAGGSQSLNIAGLDGDRTKRYSIDPVFPESISPNTDVVLEFNVFDAASGNRTTAFKKIYGQVVHMIVVDSSLNFFNHIHPELIDGRFRIETQFPDEGRYHIYLDFQPIGAVEQQIGTSLTVGARKEGVEPGEFDFAKQKTFDDYEVIFDHPDPLDAEEMSVGGQILKFTINDAESKEPITSLKPYLEAFGHLVMINTKTYDYVHVHPNDTKVPDPDQNGGPTVEFLPLGLYAPIKPGTYRLFAQFNPDGNLFTSDFIVEIEQCKI